MATRCIEDAPVSMLKDEDYKRLGYRPPFKDFDAVKSISKMDMRTDINQHFRIKSPTSKTFISPLDATEKVGPKWGIMTTFEKK